MTISITWADVEAVAPELSSTPIATQTAVLASLPLRMSEDVWGNKLDLGAALLAAHLATVSRRRGAGGALQSQSAGQVSRAFAQALSNPGNFGATSYGVEYEALLLTLSAARFDVA